MECEISLNRCAYSSLYKDVVKQQDDRVKKLFYIKFGIPFSDDYLNDIGKVEQLGVGTTLSYKGVEFCFIGAVKTKHDNLEIKCSFESKML